MSKLGELLVADGTVSPEAVKEALQAQKERGGRLGTNLIELGWLEEEPLARALGRQLHTAALFGELQLTPEQVALIPPEIADEYEVVPWSLEGNRLTVLCTDPLQIERFDRLRFRLSKYIEKVVVPEFRLWELLRRHYRAFRDERGYALRPKYDRRKKDDKKQALVDAEELIDEAEFQALYAQVLEGDPKAPATVVAAGPIDVELEELEVLEGDALEPIEEEPPQFVAKHEPYELERRDGERRTPTLPAPDDRRQVDRRAPPPALPTAPAAKPPEPSRLPPALRALAKSDSPLDRKTAEQFLEHGGRDDIARALTRFALGRFGRSLLLAVQGEVATGWAGVGGKLTPASVKQIAFSLGQDSVFKLVWETKSHYLGQFKANPIVVYFLRATGGEVPKTFFLMPIVVGGKCVNLWYCDNGHQKVASREVGDLLIVGQAASRAYARLIAEKRSQKKG